jgi:hypothetical protein
MKKVVWTLAMLTLTAGAAYAQDVNEPTRTAMPSRSSANSLDNTLIASERKINEAIAKGDKAAFTALVFPTAMSADGHGFSRSADMVAAFDQVKITSWAISDEKVIWIAPDTAIVAYKWTGAGTFNGQPIASPVYATTVWTKKGEKWMAVFHQESEAKK